MQRYKKWLDFTTEPFKTKTILTKEFTGHRKYKNFSLPLHCLLPPHRIANIGIRPPRLDSSGRDFYLSIA